MQVLLTDDIDGSEATQTLTFTFQGVSYEIDLNDDHAMALEESFHDWTSSAREVTGPHRTKPRYSGVDVGSPVVGRDLAEIRAWLRASGHKVAERGRVSQTLLAAYDKAH